MKLDEIEGSSEVFIDANIFVFSLRPQRLCGELLNSEFAAE